MAAELALAILVAGRHNVLLLDGPTDDLDQGKATRWQAPCAADQHDRAGQPGSAPFVAELAPERVLLMPDGTLDYFNNDYLELVELA